MNQFDYITKNVEKSLKEAMEEAIKYSKKRIEGRTPEDTKKLVGDYKIDPLKVVWNVFSQKIVNKTPYAFYVEYWVMGQIYKYQKPKGIIFKLWVGARMMTLTKEEDKEEIAKIIQANITVK